jgi:preprotein translocase subunit SecY
MVFSFAFLFSATINNNADMAKLYTKQQLAIQEMLPKKETIDFLLNYSKALKMVTTENGTFETIAN